MYDLQSMLDRIKKIKKEQGYTNKTLAEAIGTSEGTIGKILSGVTKDPQISTIIKIAECLNQSADYLIFGIEAATNQKKYQLLNEAGKKKADDYIDDLLENPKYQAGSLTEDQIATAVKEVIDSDSKDTGSLLFRLSQQGK